jgi:uncharacterized tellurite resistance protein B-like protein
MLEDLNAEHRLLLLKFLCAFAWTDLRVTDNERAFIERLMNKFSLNHEDREQVNEWLLVAPAPSTVQASAVPPEHRRDFIEAIRALIYADGSVDSEERELFEKLRHSLS